MVVDGNLFLLGAARGRCLLVGDDAAALGFGFEAILGAAQVLVGVADGFFVVVLLRQRSCYATRTQHGVGRINQQTLRAKFVEQRAVVAHQQADAGKFCERQ